MVKGIKSRDFTIFHEHFVSALFFVFCGACQYFRMPFKNTTFLLDILVIEFK